MNDIQSRLNPTRVAAIARPGSLDELAAVVRGARRVGRAISIAGGRHSMGGQQFGSGTLLVDTRSLDRVLAFDRDRGLITVEAGIQWPALLAYLDVAQGDQPVPWTIYQRQTGASRLTLAGALSCNAHGRGLTLPPIADQVELFEILQADGDFVSCSRTENPELFSLAVGGYGVFGIITRIVLRLRRGGKVRRVVCMAETPELMEVMAQRVRDGFEYGDFQFAIAADDDSFLRRGVCSCYRPVEADTPMTDDPVRFSDGEWLSLAVAAHVDKRKAFERYADGYLRSSGQVYRSHADLGAPYLDDYHRHVDRTLARTVAGTEMITELHVPRAAFETFMDHAGRVLRRHEADVVYGTVRLIEPDRDTFLAWAREPLACVVLNLHVDHTRAAIAAAAATFRSLIDVSAGLGGGYYLPYHRWATRDQVETCYPRMSEFLDAKLRYDPSEVFQSDWYRWHKELLAGVVSA